METVSISPLSTGSPSGLGLCRPWAATGSVAHPGPVLLCLQDLALVSCVRKACKLSNSTTTQAQLQGFALANPNIFPF